MHFVIIMITIIIVITFLMLLMNFYLYQTYRKLAEEGGYLMMCLHQGYDWHCILIFIKHNYLIINAKLVLMSILILNEN